MDCLKGFDLYSQLLLPMLSIVVHQYERLTQLTPKDNTNPKWEDTVVTAKLRKLHVATNKFP